MLLKGHCMSLSLTGPALLIYCLFLQDAPPEDVIGQKMAQEDETFAKAQLKLARLESYEVAENPHSQIPSGYATLSRALLQRIPQFPCSALLCSFPHVFGTGVQVSVQHWIDHAHEQHRCFTCHRPLNQAELQDFIKIQVLPERLSCSSKQVQLFTSCMHPT